MIFKEDMMDDLNETFFCEEEFAETHSIDGRNIVVVLTDVTEQDVRSTYGSMKTTLNPAETSISKHLYHLFIRDKDTTRKYTTNSVILVDGQRMYVQSAKHAGGAWQLIIGKSTV